MVTTHEVFNQPAPLVDVNLFSANRAMQAALAFNAPALDTAPLQALGSSVLVQTAGGEVRAFEVQ